MQKILLVPLLFITLLFSNSPVYAAKDVPVCGSENTDPQDIGIPGNINRDTRGTVTGGNCGDDAACIKLFSGGPAYRCYKLAAPGTGPAAVTNPCDDPTKCTGGGGSRCDLDNNGKVLAPSDPKVPHEGISSAIGCIPSEPKALVTDILKFITLASGGIAFLLMILGALQMITAEGNPESIKHGQERFYSAIIGLLLIIFAVLLMQVIGVDILGLPGFGKGA